MSSDSTSTHSSSYLQAYAKNNLSQCSEPLNNLRYQSYNEFNLTERYLFSAQNHDWAPNAPPILYESKF